jgi:hypothetical protein
LNDGLQPFLRWGVHADAHERGDSRDQEELPCRFHAMVRYFFGSNVSGLVNT